MKVLIFHLELISLREIYLAKTNHTNSCPSMCWDQRFQAIECTSFLELVRHKTIGNSMVNCAAGRGNYRSMCEGQTVPLSEYISYQELRYESSISYQDFSCLQRSKNSYLSMCEGQQSLIFAHNGNSLLDPQSSSENLEANEGMAGSPSLRNRKMH